MMEFKDEDEDCTGDLDLTFEQISEMVYQNKDKFQVIPHLIRIEIYDTTDA